MTESERDEPEGSPGKDEPEPGDAVTGKDSEKQGREADAAAAQQPDAEGPATPPVAESPQAQASEPAANQAPESAKGEPSAEPAPGDAKEPGATGLAPQLEPHARTEEALREDTGSLADTEEVTLISQGFLVEFDTEERLMAAAAQVRDAGYSQWDCHTPYPVHGLDGAMGVKPTILPWIVLGGGLTGVTVGMILQLYTNGILLPFSMDEGFVGTFIWPFLPSGYPYVVSGKPVFSVPANIPVAFELTILFSAFGAFFGMWGLNKLPRFWHPVFHSARFRRATDDRFFISIEAEDALYDRQRTRVLAESLGGIHVEELLGEEE